VRGVPSVHTTQGILAATVTMGQDSVRDMRILQFSIRARSQMQAGSLHTFRRASSRPKPAMASPMALGPGDSFDAS